MTHWRASGRIGSGAQANTSASRANTPRELPSGSILPFESPFERNGISQALLDIGALGFIAFFLSLLAVAVPLSGYVLLFVRY